MRKKRIMVIGPANCGKSTLANFLNDDGKLLRKTQDIIYGRNTMDVPGAYIENPWMYKHMIAAAQDASHILLLVDGSKGVCIYPPGFAKVFGCPVIGVITKADLIGENEDSCIRQLRQTGAAEPYYKISITDGTGVDILKERLFGLNYR